MTILLPKIRSVPVGAFMAVIVACTAPATSAQQVGEEQAPGLGSAAGYSHELAPTASATRLDGEITIDGLLDEAIWQQTAPISGFLQTAPLEGKPATERTEVRLAYDDDAIDEMRAQRDAWRANASMWHGKADELQAVIDVSQMSPDDKARALGSGGAPILHRGRWPSDGPGRHMGVTVVSG